MKAKKYWYQYFLEMCPVCGHESRWKERRYTRKPKAVHRRYSIVQVYDWCNER